MRSELYLRPVAVGDHLTRFVGTASLGQVGLCGIVLGQTSSMQGQTVAEGEFACY